MAFAGQRGILLALTTPCPPEEVAFGNLQVFLEGLDGAVPTVGSPTTTSTNPVLTAAKIMLDSAGRIAHEPGIITPDVVSYAGCPKYLICTCLLPHNVGTTNPYTVIQPPGTWYRITLDTFFLNSETGNFDLQTPECEWIVQMSWPETADVNGCVPATRIAYEPEEG